jgi:hypothetical protein
MRIKRPLYELAEKPVLSRNRTDVDQLKDLQEAYGEARAIRQASPGGTMATVTGEVPIYSGIHP